MDSPSSLWSAACESLKKTLHRDVYSRWIEPIAAKGSEDGVLVLAVDNDWSKFFIEQNYADFIRDALRDLIWKRMRRNPVILPIIMEI